MNRPMLPTLLGAATMAGLLVMPAGPGHPDPSRHSGRIVPVQLAADDEKKRAEQATDRLTPREENTQMPLPGQGYSHGSPLLDKAADKEKTDDALDSLKARGKVTDPGKAASGTGKQAD